jgi:hypothetical protein
MLPWLGECGERNPGDRISNKQSPRSGRQNIALLQGAEILSDVIQGWRDLRSLTPGYYLEPLRGWLS